ncbi:MAG: hypothetical protein IPJ66_07380 [Bacteroidetes bacterium]|nr:hypothetical protein [Bacteroidota bacterium]MBL0063616.1 hypothetical protein [Bacteroidota bacterium]MBL0139956.1 hypothetical protein [Bacteroidota bacterium]
MALYRFRVTFEDHDDVSRDIEIRPTQTFADFHHAIHQSIGFDASKPASFYMSDDNWKKGKEITSRELSEEETPVPLMNSSRLCDFIADPHQKIYYVFDLLGNWTFHIELIKIVPQADPLVSYPACVRTHGEAPKQYGGTGIGVLPVPEDFDPESDILDLDDEEVDDDREEEVLGTDEADLPEGEENTNTFTASADVDVEGDEFETADEDLIDDEGSTENDDF